MGWLAALCVAVIIAVPLLGDDPSTVIPKGRRR